MQRIAVSVFFFVAGLTFSTWASRIPDIKSRLHLTDAALGTILFALPVGLLTSLPFSGFLVTRFGSRKLLFASAILYPLTLITLAFSGSTWQLIIGLFFFGLWSNLMNISMNTQAVNVEASYGRSIMASFHGLWSLAGFTGALTGTLFLSYALSPTVHFVTICAVAVLLVFTFFRYTTPKDMGSTEKQPLFVKPDKSLLLLSFIAFCCLLCEGAMADWSGVYFQNVVKANPALITVGYLAFTSTMAIGRFVGDWLVLKVGVKRMLQMSGILVFGGLLISILFPYFFPASIGFLLVGFGVASVIPIVYGIAGKTSSMSTSMALAAVSTIGFLGFLLGPPVIGYIAELFNLRVSFAVIAILGLVTALLASRIRSQS